jgi:drug/metabolite transporter (DMT)-like permease
MNNKLKAHLALLIANFIYSANYTIAKLIMPVHIKPFGFVLLRVIGGMLLFGAADLLFVKQKIEKQDLPKIALLAVFGVVINQLFFFKGLSLTSPISAAIMMISTPIVVLLIAGVIIKERITLLKTIGIAIGFMGAVLLIVYGKHSDASGSGMWGNLLVLINALAWGIYLAMVKPLMKKYNTVLVLKWVFFFGFFLVLPFGFNEFTTTDWRAFSTQDWLSAAFVVICTTFIAYLLNTFALGALNPSVVSAYIYLQPVLAVLIAVYFGKDELNLMKISCALLIFTGVYMVSKPVKKPNA